MFTKHIIWFSLLTSVFFSALTQTAAKAAEYSVYKLYKLNKQLIQKMCLEWKKMENWKKAQIFHPKYIAFIDRPTQRNLSQLIPQLIYSGIKKTIFDSYFIVF